MPCLLQVLAQAQALLQALRGVWSMAGTTHLGRTTPSLATAQVRGGPFAWGRACRAAQVSSAGICESNQAWKAAGLPRLHQLPAACCMVQW